MSNPLDIPLTDCRRAQQGLLAEYDRLHTWDKVGAARGVSGAMAYRVAKEGYQPRDPEIRLKLGLPLLSEKLCADLLKWALASGARPPKP